ncbi:MAG TPA: AMP-binding protein, partial [Vicinamibacterales bacterium]
MTRRTLLDFFHDTTGATDQRSSTAHRPPSADFLIYDDGYRTWTWTYTDVARHAHAFAAMLRAERIAHGQAIAIWSENRPEWIAALWGALIEGVVLVPIDYRASSDFLRKVAGIVDAKAILVGDVVDAEAFGAERPVWRLHDVFRDSADPVSRVPHADDELGPDTTAEIIFTSGATAEPKGVVLTHRNILANIVPIEREVAKYRKYMGPFKPIRFLNLLPLSHMFGQAMATFVPPMLEGLV